MKKSQAFWSALGLTILLCSTYHVLITRPFYLEKTGEMFSYHFVGWMVSFFAFIGVMVFIVGVLVIGIPKFNKWLDGETENDQ